MSIKPRHVICVLGEWTSFAEVTDIIKSVGGDGFSLDEEYSILEPDARMKHAFEASADRVTPSFGDTDHQAIASHKAVAYVMSPSIEIANAGAVTGAATAVVAALLEVGNATAVKSESAGIAHGRERWLQLARTAAKGEDPISRAFALYEAWVRRPISDDTVFYTCGMHLLGERDIEVPSTLPVRDSLLWIDALAIFLLAEQPPDGIRDGETFRPTDKHTKRILQRTKCSRYEEDDFHFNPWGYWNLAKEVDEN